MPKKLFYKSIYNDSNNIDYIEDAIGYAEDLMEAIEDFEQGEDIYYVMQDVIEDLKKIQSKLDEQRINEWTDEKKQMNREYLSNRGIEGLVI